MKQSTPRFSSIAFIKFKPFWVCPEPLSGGGVKLALFQAQLAYPRTPLLGLLLQ
jgi:hypothetical protein